MVKKTNTCRWAGFALTVLCMAPGAHSAHAAGTREETMIPATGTTGQTGLVAGDWLVRGGALVSAPIDETSEIGLIGGEIDTPVSVLPNLSLGYFFTDHLSIDLQAGIVATEPELRNTLIGDMEIGTIWTGNVAASAQYHFRPARVFNPFVGVGLGVSYPLSTNPAEGISDFEIDTLVIPKIEAGIDYQIDTNWFATTEAEYHLVPTQTYQSQGYSFESSMDMLIVSAGLAYRF